MYFIVLLVYSKIFRSARTIGTVTDERFATSDYLPHRHMASLLMHDAQLKCNGMVTSDGYRVTDLIIELRDTRKSGKYHFAPCIRNTKCKSIFYFSHYIDFPLGFRARNIFRVYELISSILPSKTGCYIYPQHDYLQLRGYKEVLRSSILCDININFSVNRLKFDLKSRAIAASKSWFRNLCSFVSMDF